MSTLYQQVEEALDSLSVVSQEVQNLEVARNSESAEQNRAPVVSQNSETGATGASDDLFSMLGIQVAPLMYPNVDLVHSLYERYSFLASSQPCC